MILMDFELRRAANLLQRTTVLTATRIALRGIAWRGGDNIGGYAGTIGIALILGYQVIADGANASV